MTTTAVPTIRDTIENLLPPSTRVEYRYLIDNIVAALEQREGELLAGHGVLTVTTEHPIEDEILRRLDENAASMSKRERIERLETEVYELNGRVDRLVRFATRYGYDV